MTKMIILQITYANATKPSTRWESVYTADSNKLQQRYHDSLGESGQLVSSGGAETLQDYLTRGPYYHYSYIRDSEDKCTQVQVVMNCPGSADPFPPNANIFLVAWYSRGVELTTTNGQIQQVRTLSI